MKTSKPYAILSTLLVIQVLFISSQATAGSIWQEGKSDLLSVDVHEPDYHNKNERHVSLQHWCFKQEAKDKQPVWQNCKQVGVYTLDELSAYAKATGGIGAPTKDDKKDKSLTLENTSEVATAGGLLAVAAGFVLVNPPLVIGGMKAMGVGVATGMAAKDGDKLNNKNTINPIDKILASQNYRGTGKDGEVKDIEAFIADFEKTVAEAKYKKDHTELVSEEAFVPSSSSSAE